LLPIRAKGEKDMNKKKSRPMKWKPLKRIAGCLSPGLTLLEILIAIAILAIVAGIAYPSFQRIAINNYLKTAARDLASDFGLLKERSIAEFRDHRLTLDLNNNNYTLWQCANQGAGCPGGQWNQLGVKNLNNLAAGIVFDAGNTNQVDFRFQTRGTMSPMGTVAITNSRGSQAFIRINITGRTRVEFPLWQ
jgi:type IV fimbrial biogenesis protein FimT